MILILIGCAGCAHPLKTSMSSDFDPVKPMRVAVLPFRVNQASHAEGAQKIRRAFAAHLQESNLDVADIAYVDRVLAANGWQNANELPTIPAQELGESLGVDALIYGEITQWDKFYVVVHAHSALAAKADMVDARTGKRLWSTEKDAIRIKGILKVPVIIYVAPIPPTQFALQGFEMDEMTDEVTREMASPLVKAAKEGPSYAALIRRRPVPLSLENALALQKTVLEPERQFARTQEAPSEPTSAGEYAVQLCATRRQAGARELALYLRGKGYPARIFVTDLPELGTFHRVRICGFATREDARSYGMRLTAVEGLPFWVDEASPEVRLSVAVR